MLSLPTNINMLAPQRYKLDLPGCPNFCAMIQKVAHPQIVGQKLKNSGTPFANMNLAGNPLLFGDLNVTVKLDEDLFALSEIMDWMFAYGAPTSTEQFSTLTKDLTFGNNQTEYRDAILNIFDASGNPTFSINYLNLFKRFIYLHPSFKICLSKLRI